VGGPTGELTALPRPASSIRALLLKGREGQGAGKWYPPLLGKKVTPLKKNSAPDLNRRCRLTQVDLDNGRIMVVAVVVVAGEAEIPTGKGTLGRKGQTDLLVRSTYTTLLGRWQQRCGGL